MSKEQNPCGTESATWIGPEDPLYQATGLVHCAIIPSEATASEPAPLVLMLHGWAGSERSMWIFQRTIPKGVAIIAPRAPITLDEGSFVWYTYQESRFEPERDSLKSSMKTLEFFISNLPYYYPVDIGQMLVMGFSQGAMMSNAFVFTHPDEAVGVASLAGGALPMFDDSVEADAFAGFPVFVAHGDRDDVIPVEAARRTRQLYSRLGADVTYGEYPTGHKMHLDAIKNLKRWIAQFIGNNND